MDIYSRLLQDRIVFLGSGINDEVANSVVAQMLFLQSEDPKTDVTCTSIRPAAASGPAWRSTTRCSSSTATWRPIASASALDGRRPAGGRRPGQAPRMPNSRIMIHQPLAGMEGTAEEIMIHAKEFVKVKERLNRILIKHTGHPLEKIERDTDRDRFMSAEEAMEYGLIDQVIEHAG